MKSLSRLKEFGTNLYYDIHDIVSDVTQRTEGDRKRAGTVKALAKLDALRSEFSTVVDAFSSENEGAQPETEQQLSSKLKNARPNAGHLIKVGMAVVGGLFGFLGGWAALSTIDSAAISYGTIGAEGSRKAVQHLDGGVVEAILVKEGNYVKAGQELLRLERVQARAAVGITAAAVRTLQAEIARLEAESSDAEMISFPKVLLSQLKDSSVKALLVSQQQLFAARRTATAARIGTLVEQINQARAQAKIYQNQVRTAQQQHKMVTEELTPKEMLFEKGYATNSPVMQLKRTATALIGQIQEANGHITRLTHSISEHESQIQQIKSDYLLSVAQELEDARTKLANAQERERVARDILDRTVIRAPESGRILGLDVNTVGAVIGKGQRLLEIVPDKGFVIKTRFPPSDGIEITAGMRAEVRILSAQGRRLPLITGVIESRSVDARSDDKTEALYFDATVVVPEEELDALGDAKLALGTPVEVIVPTGSRTVLEYILEPVTKSMRHGMREK